MKRHLLLTAAVLAACTPFITANAATTADIIFVVDESGSMGGEHAWLGNMVTSLDSELSAAGVTGNRFGLVGFGKSSTGGGHLGRTINVGGGDFGTAAQLAAATSSLLLNGSFEDGYSGLDFARQNYQFRNNAAINYILVTDEDRDNGNNALTYASMLSSLTSQGALLNAVINGTFRDSNGVASLGHDSEGKVYSADGAGGFTSSTPLGTASGTGSTIANYYDLALASGGAAWDLNRLRAGGATAESFTKAFVSVKVREIVTTPVGVPDTGSTLLLSVVAFGALVGLRRKIRG